MSALKASNFFIVQPQIKFLPSFQNVSPNKTEMIDIVKTLNGAHELTQVMEKTIEYGTQPEPDCEALSKS